MEKRTQRTDETFTDFESAKNGLIVNNQQKQGSYISLHARNSIRIISVRFEENSNYWSNRKGNRNKE